MSENFSAIPGSVQAAAAATTTKDNTVASGATLPTLSNGTTRVDGFPVVPGPQSGFTNDSPVVDPADIGLPTGQLGPSNVGVSGRSGNNPSAFTVGTDQSNNRTLTRAAGDSSMTSSDKRLNVIRSRASKSLYSSGGKVTYGSDRGPIAKLKLLKGPDSDPVADIKGANVDVTADVNSLLAGSFTSFFLTGVNIAYTEKTQIMQTFGDSEVVYYFGRQPLIFNLSGLLFDSLENDWFSHFLTLYAGVLRGTQLAKNFSLVELTLPNMVLTGTISSLTINQDSNRDTDIPFNMQFIAKEVVPLPATIPSGSVQNLVGGLVDFKADRGGVAGYSLSTGTLGGGFMDSVNKTVGSITGAVNDVLGGLTGASASVSSTLNSFRTNIFTPVFGVISSITKIVKSVTGSISSIISSFTNPVNQVLRDIQSISAQATAVVSLVENSINSVISVPGRTVTNINNTITGLKKTVGTITRMPEDISQTFSRMYGSGHIKQGTAILSSGKARKKSKAALLTSGHPYIIAKSNTL